MNCTKMRARNPPARQRQFLRFRPLPPSYTLIPTPTSQGLTKKWPYYLFSPKGPPTPQASAPHITYQLHQEEGAGTPGSTPADTALPATAPQLYSNPDTDSSGAHENVALLPFPAERTYRSGSDRCSSRKGCRELAAAAVSQRHGRLA